MLLSIVFILVGVVILTFRTKIINLLGPSRKGDFSIDERKRKLIIGGIGSIVFGLIIFFNNI